MPNFLLSHDAIWVYRKEQFSEIPQRAMIVPTMAMANAPKAPMPLRSDAPLVDDVPVALATALPWNVVPVTTWPLIVVVTVETPEVVVVGAAVSMVVLQSVHVPVKLVHGTLLPQGPPVG